MTSLVYSNRIEQLYDQMIVKMLDSKLSPFGTRILIAPSPWVKTWLMESLACDPRISSTLGFKILSIDEALAQLKRLFSSYCPKKTPTLSELISAIEGELDEIEDQELQSWLSKNDKRKFYLSKELATLFQKYGRFCPESVSGWQKIIWDKLYGDEGVWTYPFASLSTSLIYNGRQVEIEAFGLTFLSPLEFEFLKNVAQLGSVRFWILSPCLHFWSDLTSEKEKKWLLKQAPSGQLAPLESLLSDTNPLLGNLGKLGRRFASLLEGHHYPEETSYVIPYEVLEKGGYEDFEEAAHFSSEPASRLRFIQADLLFLRNPKTSDPIFIESNDNSLEIHQLPSSLREIQWVKDLILRHLKEGITDFQVLAPDIELYIPYIERIFKSMSYSISERRTVENEPFLHLMELYRNNFKASTLIHVVKAADFDAEELIKIEEWIQKFKIHQEGIGALTLSLVNEKIEIVLLDLVSKWDQFMRSLKDNKPPLSLTLTEWINWTEKLPLLLDPQVLVSLKILSESVKKPLSYLCFMEQIKAYYLKLQEKKNEHNLGQIRFSSLTPMRSQPAEVIVMIGMKEGSLPRIDTVKGLDLSPPGLAPTRGDIDRSLFLETLLSARDHLYICWSETESPSTLVQDLIDYLPEAFNGGSSVFRHPKYAHDAKYFEKGTHLPSFSQEDFKAATTQAKDTTFSHLPTLKPLEDSTDLLPLLNIRDLHRLLKNPLDFYLKNLGIKETEDNDLDEEETLSLNSLELWKAKKRALECKTVLHHERTLFDQLKSREEKRAHQQVNSFLHQETLGKLTDVKISPTEELPLYGKITSVASDGLVVMGEKSYKEVIRNLPSLLLLKLQDPSKKKMYFLKNQKSVEIDLDPLPLLKKLVIYADKAKKTPYPFLPDLIEAFIGGDVKKVEEGLSKYTLSQSAESVVKSFQEEAIHLFGGIKESL